jgi:MYXO-CTERM domain-containing protein
VAPDAGGCGCSLRPVGHGGAASGVLLAALAFAAAFRRRRR